MINPENAPFQPAPDSMNHLSSNLDTLGLTSESCLVAGPRAFYLQGLVKQPGRADLIVSREDYESVADRFRGSDALTTTRFANDVATNETLVYYTQRYRGRINQIHIVSRLASNELDEVATLDSMAAHVLPIGEFRTIEPVTGLTWLMARRYMRDVKDESVAFRALQSLQETQALQGMRLRVMSGRAARVWSDRER